MYGYVTEGIDKKYVNKKMSIMFNKIYISEEMLPKYPYLFPLYYILFAPIISTSIHHC